MRFDSGAIFHTVSKKLLCAFESKLAKCCPSSTCTRIGSRSGSVKGGADHFTVPLRVFFSLAKRPVAPGSRSASASPCLSERPWKPPKCPGR
jgi:hypothetical protein